MQFRIEPIAEGPAQHQQPIKRTGGEPAQFFFVRSRHADLHLLPGQRLLFRPGQDHGESDAQIPRQGRRVFGRQSGLQYLEGLGEFRFVAPRQIDFGPRHPGPEIGRETPQALRGRRGLLQVSHLDQVLRYAGNGGCRFLLVDDFKNLHRLTFETGDLRQRIGQGPQPGRQRGQLELVAQGPRALPRDRPRIVVKREIPGEQDEVGDLAPLDQRVRFLEVLVSQDEHRGRHAAFVFPRERAQAAQAAIVAERRGLVGRSQQHHAGGSAVEREPARQVPLDQTQHFRPREIIFLFGLGPRCHQQNARQQEQQAAARPGEAVVAPGDGARRSVCRCHQHDQQKPVERVPPEELLAGETERHEHGSQRERHGHAALPARLWPGKNPRGGSDQDERQERREHRQRQSVAGNPRREVSGDGAVRQFRQPQRRGVR